MNNYSLVSLDYKLQIRQLREGFYWNKERYEKMEFDPCQVDSLYSGKRDL